MNNQGLLFIPDISGFTRFVTETEIDHSRRIIQELLEVVIEANQIGLEVSEIEGDAVLFFKFGDSPDLKQLYEQVERTFRQFHERLAAYASTRFCWCRACASAGDLTLKVITHYGEFTTYTVGKFMKLIGRDVIVAHQLLKNDIDHHEYWLLTSGFQGGDAPDGLPPWLEWSRGVKRTESGEIAFRYAPLSELRRSLAPVPIREPALARMTKVFSASRGYAAHIIPLFHATGDFTYRSRWQDGVRSVEMADHSLPRVGMRCRRVMDNGEASSYASSYSSRADRIEFSETDEDERTTTYFTLEAVEPNRTKLTVDVYRKKGVASDLIFRLKGKRKLEASWDRSLDALEKLVTELRIPTEY